MVKFKGIEFDLGGTVYVVPPLSMGDLEVMQDKLAAFENFSLNAASAKVILEVAHRALKRNYPEIKVEELAELVDLGNAMELFQAVMDISGLRRREIEAGKTQAPAKG